MAASTWVSAPSPRSSPSTARPLKAESRADVYGERGLDGRDFAEPHSADRALLYLVLQMREVVAIDNRVEPASPTQGESLLHSNVDRPDVREPRAAVLEGTHDIRALA